MLFGYTACSNKRAGKPAVKTSPIKYHFLASLTMSLASAHETELEARGFFNFFAPEIALRSVSSSPALKLLPHNFLRLLFQSTSS